MPSDLRDGDGARIAVDLASLDGWTLTWSYSPLPEPPAPPRALVLVQILPDGAGYRVMLGFTPTPSPISGYLAHLTHLTPLAHPAITHFVNVSAAAQWLEVRHLLPGRYQAWLQSRLNTLGGPIYSPPSARLDFMLGEELPQIGLGDPYAVVAHALPAPPVPQLPAPAPAGGGWWCATCRAWVAVSEAQADGDTGALCFTCGERNTERRNA
jgi:hypothetical protein